MRKKTYFKPDLFVIAAGQATSAYLTPGLFAPLNHPTNQLQPPINPVLLPNAALHMSVTQVMLVPHVARNPP